MSISNAANQYDAIVIGSGTGGLTTAAILSKYSHKKVLVFRAALCDWRIYPSS